MNAISYLSNLLLIILYFSSCINFNQCRAQGQLGVEWAFDLTLLPNTFMAGGSMAFADINGDYLDDIIRTDNRICNVVIQEEAPGNFIEGFELIQNETLSTNIADIDGDGKNEILLATINGGIRIIDYENEDLDIKHENTISFFPQGSSCEDIDGDQYIDYMVTDDNASNFYLRNDANNAFESDVILEFNEGGNIVQRAGNYGTIWVDVDNDGDRDMYLIKCRAGAQPHQISRINRLYINDNSSYSEAGAQWNMRDSSQNMVCRLWGLR